MKKERERMKERKKEQKRKIDRLNNLTYAKNYENEKQT